MRRNGVWRLGPQREGPEAPERRTGGGRVYSDHPCPGGHRRGPTAQGAGFQGASRSPRDAPYERRRAG